MFVSCDNPLIDKLLFIAYGDLDLVRDAIFADPDLSAIVAYIVKHRNT
jgi:hypothetical protein